jgi:outer membrane receptor protein involved in Fe transport
VCFPIQDPDGRINRCTPPGGTPGANDSPPGYFPEDFFIDGRPLTNASRWAASFSIHFEQPLAREWGVFGSLNASYRGARNASPILHPLAAERSHWLVNVECGVRSPQGRWELSLWATNLGDELERGLIFNTPMQGGSLHAFVNAPRMWGGRLRYAF